MFLFGHEWFCHFLRIFKNAPASLHVDSRGDCISQLEETFSGADISSDGTYHSKVKNKNYHYSPQPPHRNVHALDHSAVLLNHDVGSRPNILGSTHVCTGSRRGHKDPTSWWRLVNTIKNSHIGWDGVCVSVCVCLCTHIPYSHFGKHYLFHEQKERKRCFKEPHAMSGT